MTELQPVGAGIENLVCSAELRAFGPIAVRTPWTRMIDNENDGLLSARYMLKNRPTLGQV